MTLTEPCYWSANPQGRQSSMQGSVQAAKTQEGPDGVWVHCSGQLIWEQGRDTQAHLHTCAHARRHHTGTRHNE